MVAAAKPDELARAKERLLQAQRNQLDKGRAYDADPLFRYLWRVGWGTPAYTGTGLVRVLDGWVARVCRFEDARVSYWLLNEIPDRLRLHIRALEQAEQS